MCGRNGRRGRCGPGAIRQVSTTRVRHDVLAALKALIAGVKVRCEVVERDQPLGRQGLLAQWGRHRSQVDVGSAGVPALLEGLC